MSTRRVQLAVQVSKKAAAGGATALAVPLRLAVEDHWQFKFQLELAAVPAWFGASLRFRLVTLAGRRFSRKYYYY